MNLTKQFFNDLYNDFNDVKRNNDFPTINFYVGKIVGSIKTARRLGLITENTEQTLLGFADLLYPQPYSSFQTKEIIAWKKWRGEN